MIHPSLALFLCFPRSLSLSIQFSLSISSTAKYKSLYLVAASILYLKISLAFIRKIIQEPSENMTRKILCPPYLMMQANPSEG
jgi:hypothetical protein